MPYSSKVVKDGAVYRRARAEDTPPVASSTPSDTARGMKPNDRYVIFSSTGGGKTTLGAALTLNVQNLAVFDVKRELAWLPNSVVVRDVNALTFRRREIFQPPPGMESDRELFERFCERAYQRGKVMVWIDEAAFVTTPSYIPEYLKNILVAGRARGIGCMALSQSGAGLSHPLLFRSAEHVFVGYGNQRMLTSLVDYLGPTVLKADALKQYEGRFLVFESNAKQPKVFGPVNVAIFGGGYAPQQ